MIPLSTWSEGYVTDISYTTNFFHHQVPDFLNFCLLLYGFEPLDLNKEFTYCELGCGKGLTSLIMAILYPHANFYAIDFNPEHIFFAEKIKEKIGLNNIKFIEISFKEMVDNRIDEFPEFDFITLHGVFSWINHENRLKIVEFANRKLKPGGVLNVSYNDMCGWFMMIPFQRFIVDFAKLFPEVISVRKVETAMKTIKRIQEVGGLYFNIPPLKKRLHKMDEQEINYIVHEYLNEDWQPLFFTDVLSYMQKAKLKYVGMADPIWKFEKIVFSEAQLKELNKLRSAFLREMVKDYILNLSFRKDIFVKGGSFLPPSLLQKKIQEEVKFILNQPKDEKIYKIEIPYSNKNVNLKPEIVDKIVDLLEDGKKNLKELNDEINIDPNELLSIIVMLVHKKIVDPVFETDVNKELGVKFNRFVAKDARYKNELRFFILPETKSAVFVDIIKRLVYDAVVNEDFNDIEKVKEHVIGYLEEDIEKSLEGKGKQNLDEKFIDETISLCIEEDFPFWERLGAL